MNEADTPTRPSMRAPLPPRRKRRLTTLLDHRASVAAFQAVQVDVGNPDGPPVSYATVCEIIETFLETRERLQTAGPIR